MKINVKLDKDFTREFYDLYYQHGASLAALNGFGESQLDYTDFIDNFVDEDTVADASIDGNANVGHKDIVSLENEMSKPHSKLLGFNKIFYELKKEYGLSVAQRWLRAEWTGLFYLHDAYNTTYKPYCFRGDTKILTKQGIRRLYELVNKEIYVLGKNHGWEPATVKHFGKDILWKLTLERYGVRRDIFVTGNHKWFVQAISRYVVMETEQLEPGMQIPYNEFGQEDSYEASPWVVKSVVNTGIEDDVYCAVVPGSQSFTLDGNILTHNCYAYDIEDLIHKGMYFVDNFNAQPPQHLVTYTDFVSEFISWCCNRTSGAVGVPSFLIYSYYFWQKDVNSGFYQKSPEYYRDQEFQRIIYKLNQPFLRGGIQSAFTNFSIFDRPYLEALFGGKEYPDGTFIIDYIEELIEYQKAFMNVLSNIRAQNMMTFPVMSFSLLKQNGKFVDEPFAKWCCRHNMKWADSNFFISDDINSLSNCCRLKSNIKDLGYFNSIGGTALEVGSIKVNTINLARISYEYPEEQYFTALKERVVLCLQVLDRIRHIIRRNVEKGLLPNYSLDILSMESQYNTIGIIGIYETLQKYGYTYKDEFGYTYYSDEGIEFAKKILKTIHEVKDEFAKGKDYMINIEQIPGERAAYILMGKDKYFYPNEAYELPLYGNQWIPLGVKTTIQEKVKLSAILDDACSGGSIAHINLDAPLTDFDTAWQLLNYVSDAGVTYFAFNLRISACEKNHGFYGDVCPICGGTKTTSYQRIVGFLTPERTYSKERKEEFQMRDWFTINMMDEI